MSSRLCRCCSGWHSLDEPWPQACAKHFRARSARSDLPRPTVISDALDGIQSMVSGERFDSKSDLRRHYKANGMVEVGNDKITPKDRDDVPIEPIEREVAKAFDRLGA